MALSVNGEKIDEVLVEQEAERLRPEYEQAFADMEVEERNAQLHEWAQENVIERALLNQYARSNGGDVEKNQVDAILEQIKQQNQGQSFEQLSPEDQAKVIDSIELQIKVERILREVCKDVPEPTEEAITEYYKNNEQQFKTPEEVRVAHIVKHVNWQCDEESARQAISQVKQQLNEGILFESLVSKHSDCPDNGGDLGYITRGKMVEEFEAVVFNLGVGEVSDIFQTRFGFHIAKVYDRKESSLVGLDQVRENISGFLKEQLNRDTIDRFLDELKSKAKIEQ